MFGPVRQVGYVVEDIERAMLQWSSLGVGPWFYKEEVVTTEFRYRGQESTLPRLSIALANSGDLQLELIQQRDDAPSLYRDTLAKQGESAQHVAYWTRDRFDEFCAILTAQGYEDGHSGRMGAQRGRFAYFFHPDLPSAMVEISESTGGKAEYFEEVRKAAFAWDGNNPILRIS
ncbi:VOC family protein [uncultured Xylophilus sp.]|uniref:VOC family protein n=1 Tax=uncultured Xylophilus sp. TaxID=296832 RepID=UPI0025F88CF2|nr:VOC family protein [uncultured Xylophilus sp.]